MLDLVDEPLDQIALLVEVLVVRDGARARAARWNYCLRADFSDRCAKAIGIKAHIGDQVFEVRIFTELGEKTLPNALFCPSPETPEHAVPFAKLFGQVTPRRSGTDQPQHTVDEQPIVLAVPPLVAFLAWNKRFNAPPLRVRQLPPNQNRPPQLRS